MEYSREKGLEIFRGIYGDAATDGLERFMESGGFGAACARWATDFAFGTVWASDRLERQKRSCAILGMMIALRQSDEIYFHTRVGLANGLTRVEIEEVLNSAVPYCGLPAANVAKAAMLRAFAEIDAAA